MPSGSLTKRSPAWGNARSMEPGRRRPLVGRTGVGGVPYCHRDVRLPEFLPVIGPMDTIGDGDNAVTEAFCGRMQTELGLRAQQEARRAEGGASTTL